MSYDDHFSAKYGSGATLSPADDAGVRAQSSFFNRVYGWMCAGLAITGVIAWFVGNNAAMQKAIYQTPAVFIILLLVELALVFGISAAINRISAAAATGGFMLYAALNGLTLGWIFMAYTQSSIAATFFVTSLTFGSMSLFGYVTRIDLTPMGRVLGMLLWGLIIATIVNIFWANSGLYWITTYAGLLIFVGLTAYDTQKIREFSLAVRDGGVDGETAGKFAVIAALTLYLDFINIFLYLLRLFGDRRN